MKKRVLMVSCEGLGNGGVQAIMMGIIRNLHAEYHFDMLLFTQEKRHYEDEFLQYGGKIFRIPHYNGHNKLLGSIDSIMRDSRIYHELIKILKKEPHYDIMHCNKEYESAPILKAAAKYNIPIRICHTHVEHYKPHFLKCIINSIRVRILEKYATQLIGCSEQACSTIYRANYKIINNFYDSTRFKYSNICAPEKLVLTQVAAICYNKNQLFSIKILKSLLEKGLDVKLNLIGFIMEDEYKNKLDEFILDQSLSNYVEFKPGDCNIPFELENSSCFIIPSFSEGFSISIIEAQAIGIHCFGSTAIPEITNCGNADYFNLSDGADIWADAIVNWYNKSCGVKHLCNTGKYSITSVMESYRNLYNGEY